MKLIKNIIKKIVLSPLKVEKGKILVVDTTPYSGSNTYVLYDYIKNVAKYSNIRLLTIGEIQSMSKRELLKEKATSEIIITSHSAEKYKKSQKIIQLWHGVPLKSMGLLDKEYSDTWEKDVKKVFDDVDYIATMSQFYTTLLNSTIGQRYSKYIEIGYPRNDLLLNKDDSFDLSKIIKGIDISNKNIYYVPTFRQGYVDRVEGKAQDELFGFEKGDIEKISEYCVENKLNLILKLHPFEEKICMEKYKDLKLENIYFLTNDLLEKSNKDLYECLSKSDMLITDYSSVYYDYLLTEKPILFVNNDEEEYRNTRGFILEPYKEWTPGPKVQNCKQLLLEIEKLLSDNNYYRIDREKLTDIVHKFKNNDNCERTWNYLKNKFRLED